VRRRPDLARGGGDGLGRQPRGVRGGRGGQEVGQVVRAHERQGHVQRAATDPQVEAHARQAAAPVPGGDLARALAPEPDHAPGVAPAHPQQVLVVGVEHRHAAGPEPLQDLGLGLGDGLQRVEELQVHGGHAGDHGHVGLRQPRQLAQLAGVVHAQLQHGRALLREQPQQCQRQAVPVVQVALGLEHRAERAQQGRRDLLGGGLADRAGDDQHGQPRRPARGAREVGQGARGVRHAHESQAARRLDGAVHQRGPGAAVAGGREVVVAVQPLAVDGHEQLARQQRARVDRHPRDHLRQRRRTRQPAAAHGLEHAGEPAGHARQARDWRAHRRPRAASRSSSSRATSRSSKGRLRSRTVW
jgi:hypothetical protein